MRAIALAILFGTSLPAHSAGPIDVLSRPIYQAGFHEQLAADAALPSGAVLLIGDSIIYNIPDVRDVDPRAINYGIIGDTTSRHRVPRSPV